MVLLIYKITENFPRKEIFGLSNQMRRAAVSVTSNIAEGFGRLTVKDKCQFYSISQGSLLEIQSQLFIAHDVGYLDKKYFEEILKQIIIVNKLLSGLKRIRNT